MNLGGDNILTSHGEEDVFVAKLITTTSGVVAIDWAQRMGSSDVEIFGDLAMTADSNALYLTGYYHDKADFGNVMLTGQGDMDMFVAKVNPSNGVTISAEGSGWAGK